MKGLLMVLSLFFFFNSVAINAKVDDIKGFSSYKEELRYNNLIDELRCLVCQNQNLAGSNSGLAQDLRKKVYDMISSGKSNDEIKEFMVTRYGDFILYRPPFNATTFILWVGPFVILIFAIFVLLRFIRQRKNIVVTTLNNSDKEKLKLLLKEDKEQTK